MTPSDPTVAEPLDGEREGRRLHPFTLLFSTIGVARRLVLPALFGGLSAGAGDAGRIVLLVVAMLTIPSFALAVAHYLTFRYRVTDEELVYRSGVLRRRQRVIPLARLQNIEVRQSFVQRLAGVAEVRVETAGSGREPEAALSVLGRADAEALRDALLVRRGSTRREAIDAEPDETATQRPEALVRLTPPELAIAGATANEAGLIAAALIGALQFLDDLPVSFDRYLPDVEGYLASQSVGSAIVLAIGFIVAIIVIGWIFSVVGSVIGYYDFTLTRTGNELHKRYGLLSTREANVPLRRVQSIRVEESLLRRPLSLAALKIETAGGPVQRQRGGAEAFVPIAHARRVPELVQALFPAFAFGEVRLSQVHPRSIRRATTRYALVLILMAAGLAVLDLRALGVLAGIPMAWLLARWQYRMRGYALADGHVVLRGGVANRVTWIVPDEKIQTLHVSATPFQRRHGLASLVVDTASGGAQPTLIDLGADTAEVLLEELTRRARAARERLRRGKLAGTAHLPLSGSPG